MSDLIDRQVAIEAIQREARIAGGIVAIEYADMFEYVLKQLPSAEVTLCHLDSPCEYQNADIAMPTAEKVGKWIYKKYDDETGIEDHEFCSECGFPRAQIYGNFCAVCGARMKGDGDETD